MTGYQSRNWVALEAVHDSPLGQAVYWTENNFCRWITDNPDESINSTEYFCDPIAIGYSTVLRSPSTPMEGDTISFYYAVANFWVRTATKVPSLKRIHMKFQGNALISSFWSIPPAAPTNFYDGISGKRFWGDHPGTGLPSRLEYDRADP